MINALTIDVEEFFQIHALSETVSIEDWINYPSQVEANTQIILDILEKASVKATFFCLGWVGRKCPSLIKKIANARHEVASHGDMHQVIYSQDRKTFRQDIVESKKLLEDITGKPVLGYRAPTYSITEKTIWALDELEQAGFKYDSSIFPIHHDNYGIPSAPRFPYKIEGRNLAEFPISTIRFGKLNLPISGGGYFRLFPYLITKAGLMTIENTGNPFVFYIHPWEFNPGNPKVEGLSTLSRFRSYINLSRTKPRYEKLVKDFSFSTMENSLKDLGLL